MPNLPRFMEQTASHLVSHDISPTDCILSIYKDNRTVSASISDETVRGFVVLAAEQHAPRFVRFLRGIMRVAGRLIKRNQGLIIHCLEEKEAAILLYRGHDGRAERDALIRANDHVHNPRGRLMYHIELVAMLAEAAAEDAATGQNASVQMQVREMFPLPELLAHIASDGLAASGTTVGGTSSAGETALGNLEKFPQSPMQVPNRKRPQAQETASRASESREAQMKWLGTEPELAEMLEVRAEKVMATVDASATTAKETWRTTKKAARVTVEMVLPPVDAKVTLPVEMRFNYLELLCNAYLASQQTSKEVSESVGLHQLLASLVDELVAFDPTTCASIGLSATDNQAAFFCAAVPTLTLFFRHHYRHGHGAFADHLSALSTAIAASRLEALDEWVASLLRNPPAGDVLPVKLVSELMAAMHECGMHVSAAAPAHSDTTVTVAASDATEPAEHHPQEFIDDYMDDFYSAENGHAEIDGLVDVFRLGLNKALKRANELVKGGHYISFEGALATQEDDVRYTRSLMQHLLSVSNARTDIDEEEEELEFNEELVVALLGILSDILDSSGPKIREQTQSLLNRLGGSTLVLKFAACSSSTLAPAGMRLGKSLLVGDCEEVVQASLLELLKENGSSIAPADGSEGGFFPAMKARCVSSSRSTALILLPTCSALLTPCSSSVN